MSSRLQFRLLQLGALFIKAPGLLFKRKYIADPKRILVIHQLLLGDALMATGLLAQLRKQFPNSDIVVAGPPLLNSVYSSHPYQVEFIPFNPKNWRTFFSLWREKTFDHAYVVLDNRFSWTAFAIGCRNIIGYQNTKKSYKDVPFSHLLPFPNQQTSIVEIMSGLVDGQEDALEFQPHQWPSPESKPYQQPNKPYVVMHIGASTPLKHWHNSLWLELARNIESLGYQPVWSAGPGEGKQIEAIDPQGLFPSYAEKLNLAQMWHLIKNAALLVCPDTGISHIAKHTFTPTICLFGPGNKALAGYSVFFAKAPFLALDSKPDCRNQHTFFKRQIDWVQHCKRSVKQCPYQGKCTKDIKFETVLSSVQEILSANTAINRE